jgi:hypothetical protein
MDPETPNDREKIISADSGFGAGAGLQSQAAVARSSPSPSRRSRRYRQENSDDSTESTIDAKDPLRHGYPHLQPLPLYNWLPEPHTEECIGWSDLLDIVAACLKTYLPAFKAVLFDRRPRPQDGPNTKNENLTCLVITKRDRDSDAWRQALRAIELQFVMCSVTGLTVEFLDPEVLQYNDPHTHFALESNDPIVSQWHHIKPEVVELINSFEWATLSVIRRGRFLERLENPTTILVGAPLDTLAVWPTIIDAITDILVRFKLAGIVVVVIPIRRPFSALDQLDEPTKKLIDISEFERTVDMGASFAPKAEKTSASIGGTLRLWKQDGTSLDVLMSIFHPFCFITSEGMSIGTLSSWYYYTRTNDSDRNI